MPYKIVKSDTVIKVPKGVAVCPICGARLYADTEEWEEDDYGMWRASNPKTTCAKEPDIDSRKWNEWHRWHYSMPYVDWLPVDMKVQKWMDRTYRFDLSD